MMPQETLSRFEEPPQVAGSHPKLRQFALLQNVETDLAFDLQASAWEYG